MKSVEGSAQQAFGYQGTNRIYATNVNASSTADYFYANGLLVASRNASAVSYYQEDAIGSVRLAMNVGGSQTYSSAYRPFGTSYGTTGSSSVGYAGKPSDSVTGLYYFGARFYDPTVERFITEDSVSGAREDPLSLNRYIYARDNPLGITDPTGHDWWSTLTQAVSNAASTFVSKVSSQASAIINTWNGLPPPVKVGIVIGVSAAVAIATVGVALPAIAAVDAGAIGTLGVGVAVEAVPEVAPDAATIASTIDAGLQSAVVRAMVNKLTNLGSEPANSDAVGEWGENFMRPLMRAFGFVQGKIIQTSAGELRPDYFHPDTGVAVDIKVGQQSVTDFAETQMTKYALAKMEGQVSNSLEVFYFLIPGLVQLRGRVLPEHLKTTESVIFGHGSDRIHARRISG